MLNEKMYKVAVTIEEVIIRTYPAEYQMLLFGGRITISELISQILVECCKYAYDDTAAKHSLRYYLNQEEFTSENDAERMLRQRTIKYINDKRVAEYEHYMKQGIRVDDLLPKEMKTADNKTAGYQYNAFQYWEINNVHDMELVKAIVERKIGNKNYKREYFKACAMEYDKMFAKYKSMWGEGDDQVFDFLALFNLEWKYSFDFYYAIVSKMVELGVQEIPDLQRRLSAFSGCIAINSELMKWNRGYVGGTIHTDSRMLVLRKKYVEDIVKLSIEEFEEDLNQFTEAIVVVSDMILHMTYRGVPIKQWFVENSSEEDWISVFANYDVFQIFEPDKDWSDKKKIRFMKKIYNQMSINYKNPDFRS